MVEWTNGWKVINFKIKDDQYHGFIKVTKKHEIVIECKSDINCRPLDKVLLNSYENLIVQKIITTKTKSELHCIKDEKQELKKSIFTKKKLKKALGDDNEQI